MPDLSWLPDQWPKNRKELERDPDDFSWLPDYTPRLLNIYNYVHDIDPLHSAQVMNASKRLQIPELYLDKHLDEELKLAEAPTLEFWQWYEDKHPNATRHLLNPRNMATAKDLLPELAEQETIFTLLGKGYHSGALNVEMAELGWGQMLDTLRSGKRSTQNEERLNDLEREMESLYRPGGLAPTFYLGEQIPILLQMAKKGGLGAAIGGTVGGLGALALGQLGPQIAAPEEAVTVPVGTMAGIKIGAKLGGSMGIAEASAILEGGSAFREFIKLKDRNGNPIDPQLAAQAAFAVGALNAGMELVSAKMLLRTIPGGEKILNFMSRKEVASLAKDKGKTSIIKEGMKRYLQSMIGESMTEVAQETVTQLGAEASKKISGQDFDYKSGLEILAESAQVISPTLQTAGIFGLPGLSVHVIQGTRRVKQAQTDAQVYKTLGEAAEKSEYLNRLPDGWRTLAEMNMQGGKLENIYVEKEPLVKLLQSAAPQLSGEESLKIVARELGIEAQLEEAQATGKALKIPYATWLEKVVKTPLYKQMEPHIKFSEDGITLSQAAVTEEETHRRIGEEQARAEEMIARNETLRMGHDAVYADVKSKLEAAGRPGKIPAREWPSYVDKAAKLWAAHAVAEASKRGISPEEWYQGANRPEVQRGEKAAGGKFRDMALEKILNQGESAKEPWQMTKEEYLQYIPENQKAFIDLLQSESHPDIAEEGSGYFIQWADGRGLVAYKNKQDAIAFISQGDREVVSVKYRKREKGETVFDTFEQDPDLVKSKNEIHQNIIRDAVSAGKPVPEEVLKEYHGDQYFQSSAAIEKRVKELQQAGYNRNDIIDILADEYQDKGYDPESHIPGYAQRAEFTPEYLARLERDIIRLITTRVSPKTLELQLFEQYNRVKGKVQNVSYAELADEAAFLKGAMWHGREILGRTLETIGDTVGGEEGRLLPEAFGRFLLGSGGIRRERARQARLARTEKIKERPGQNRGVIFYQGESGPRAEVNILPEQSMITLFAKADASSFLHESAHLFLNDTFEFVRSGQADDRYLADWKTLSQWLKISNDQTELTREQHEQFARGFERYLMEGKAPSEGLRKAFAAFRRWLMKIYRDVTGLDVELSDEVRQVMDRMIATEDEIQEREALNGYLTDVISERDVSPETWGKLKALKEKAHEMAVQALLNPQMKELQPEHEEFLKQERERVRPIIEEEVAKLPIYKVMEGVRVAFGPTRNVKDIARKFREGKLTMQGKRNGNWVFGAVADAFGYDSPDRMAREILEAPLFAEEVKARLETHMAMYGDLRESAQFSHAAEVALRSEEQMDVLAMERVILADLIKKEEASQGKRKFNMERARIAAAAARRFARNLLAGKPYREAGAATSYFGAEREAAVKEYRAYAAKDVEGAAKYAEQRLLNHALALESLKVKAEVEKHFKYLEKFQRTKRPEIGQEFLNQIDKILERFGMMELSPNAKEDKTTLNEWIKSREKYDDAAIPETIADESFRKDYRDLSLGELRDLADAVKNIETVGRNEKRLLTDERNREFSAVVTEIVRTIKSNNKALFPGDYDPNESKAQSANKFLRGFLAQHKKVEWIVRGLDGYKDQGPCWRYLILPLMRAMDKEYAMRREVGEEYSSILQKYYGKEISNLATQKVHVAEVAHLFPKGLTKENILMMALNWGTKLNQKRLVDGYLKSVELSGEEVRDIIREARARGEEKLGNDEIIYQYQHTILKNQIETIFEQQMSKNDWDFVQDIWDLIEKHWPMIVETERIRKGVEPRKREAQQFKTKWGEYRGGYFHIDYDPSKSEQAKRYNEQENLKEVFEVSYITPSTNTGFVKATVDTVLNRPLNLHLSGIDRHLSREIHMISFINAIRDVNKIIDNQEVITAIKETYGDEVYDQFKPWLLHIGYEYRNPVSDMEKILSRARVGASVVNMGFKFTTAFSQYAGLPAIMERLGGWRTLGGVLEFHGKFITGRAKEDIDFVFSKSEMMRNRSNNRDRDIKDTTRKLVLENKYDQVKETYFAMTSLFDYAITIPAWTQAYNKHIEQQLAAKQEVNEEMAVRFADQVIRETQGSGDIINMAGIQRGPELQKLFTQFYSYFSVFANKLMESGERAIRRGEYGQLIATCIYWWFIPAVAGELLAGRGPDPEEDEGLVKWMLSTIFRYPFGAFILVRDVVNALGARWGGYEMSPTAEALDKSVQLWNATVGQISEGDDVDWGKAGKIAFEGGGYWFHYPAKQIEITVGNIFDAMTGDEDFHLRDLFFRKR